MAGFEERFNFFKLTDDLTCKKIIEIAGQDIKDQCVNGAYLVNIQAQCDIQRPDDPILYCLIGMPFKKVCKDAKNTLSDGKIKLQNGKTIAVNELQDLLKDINETTLAKLDQIANLGEYEETTYLKDNEILEKKNEACIACINGETAIRFSLKKIVTIRRSEINGCFVGRILPPYITHIRQKWAMYVIREGMMPIPSEVFPD